LIFQGVSIIKLIREISAPEASAAMTPDQPAPVSVYKEMDQACLSLDHTFTFRCHAGLGCFNRCCRTPTILLSPYDLLRLKQALGITSGELLARYTRREIDAQANLPLIFLDPCRTPESACPFLGPPGCTVYAQRPAACRLFPITMGSELTDAGVVDYYFCRKLDYCEGFATDVRWTVASWIADQGFAAYDQGRRAWLEILLQAGLKGPGALDARFQELFALTYDLDRGRGVMAEAAFRETCPVEAEALALLQADDLALMKFIYRNLQAALSGKVA
jgi:Fe-S-cluster containining protein